MGPAADVSKGPRHHQSPAPLSGACPASPAAAAREGFEACVDALQQLNIDARIE